MATVSAEKARDSKDLISSKSRTEGLVDEPCSVFLDRFVLGGYPVIRSSKLLIVFVAVGDIIISLLSYA